MPRAVRKPKPSSQERFLVVAKLAMYLGLGLVWIKLDDLAVFPLGLILGVLLATRERFQIDRKLEYALVLVGSLIAYAGPGIFLVWHYSV